VEKIQKQKEKKPEAQKPFYFEVRTQKQEQKYVKGQPVVYRGQIMEYGAFERSGYDIVKHKEYLGHSVCDTKTETYRAGIKDSEIRPAVSKDYEREIDGVKVRVYEDKYGIRVVTSNRSNLAAMSPFNVIDKIVIARLKTLIPFIPLSVSRGEFTPPEE